MGENKQTASKQTTKAQGKPRRIVICLDGTWNNPESSTNVYSLFKEAQGVDARFEIPNDVKDERQLRYYDEGVGSSTQRAIAGATGLGLSLNICQAYDFICRHYQKGDQLYIFGFSRGAYTARSLVGLIHAVGLLPRYWADRRIPLGSDGLEHNLENKQSFPDDLIRAALDAYKANNFYKHQKRSMRALIKQHVKRSIAQLRKEEWRAKQSAQEKKDEKKKEEEKQKFKAYRSRIHKDFTHRWSCREDIRVHFLGVWDTVGALGVPSFLPRWLQGSNPHAMHDTEMCGSVDYAYHALAIDEHRRIFAHTPWTKIHKKNKAVEQRWFVGAHANIGGGVRDNRLHGAAQAWLVGKAIDNGLKLHHGVSEDPYWKHEPISDSYSDFMLGLYKKLPKQQAYKRKIFVGASAKVDQHQSHDNSRIPVNESIDESVWQYLDTHPNYRPRNLPLDARPGKRGWIKRLLMRNKTT